MKKWEHDLVKAHIEKRSVQRNSEQLILSYEFYTPSLKERLLRKKAIEKAKHLDS